MVKVIGIVGSPRKGGNTELLVNETLKAVREEGLETELVRLAGKNIKHCDGCRVCRTTRIGECRIKDDLETVFEKMVEADGIILGSPVYVGSATSQVKALVDRVTMLAGAKGRLLENKVGGPIVVARRAGHNFTFAQLLYFFFITGMIVPGATYWTVAFGTKRNEVAKDEEGMKTVRNFGKKIAWLAKKLIIGN